MCPVCCKEFSDKDVVIEYQYWNAKNGEPESKQYGHLDCVLHVSGGEKRDHPPKK